MNKRSLLIYGVILLICGGGLWYWHHVRTPEYLVSKTITSAAEAFSKVSGETNSTAAFKALVLGNLFAPQVELAVEGIPMAHGTLTDEEMLSYTTRGRMAMDAVSVVILKREIKVTGNENARAYLEVRLQGSSTKGYKEKYSDILHLQVTLLRSEADGKWRFNSCRTVKLIQK